MRKHHCQYLQNAWTKHGEQAFAFAIVQALAEVSPAERLAAERKWVEAIGLFNSLISSADGSHFTMSEAVRAKSSAAFRQRLATDAALRKRLQQRGRELAKLLQSPAGRAMAALATRKRWANPVERAKLATGLLNRWNEPQARRRHAEVMRELRSTPDERKRQSSALKAAWKDPIKGARLRQRQESRWLDPGARERQAAKIRAHHARRRSMPQREATPREP